MSVLGDLAKQNCLHRVVERGGGVLGSTMTAHVICGTFWGKPFFLNPKPALRCTLSSLMRSRFKVYGKEVYGAKGWWPQAVGCEEGSEHNSASCISKAHVDGGYVLTMVHSSGSMPHC